MMTLHLPPELESRLRNEAAREGVEADKYVVRTLQRVFPGLGALALANLSQSESELLAKVGMGCPKKIGADIGSSSRKSMSNR